MLKRHLTKESNLFRKFGKLSLSEITRFNSSLILWNFYYKPRSINSFYFLQIFFSDMPEINQEMNHSIKTHILKFVYIQILKISKRDDRFG